MFKRAPAPAPRVGLALSGGSTWGIAHVGVLKALAEAGIPIHMIAGTSAGSLVAACYAFGMSIEDMEAATGELDWKKLSKFSYSRLGLRSNAPMEGYITDLLGDVQIQDAHMPLAIVAADIRTHEKLVLREGSLHEAVRASTAIPGFFRPVMVGDRMLVDGAIAENLPVPSVRELGADFIIAVNLSSRSGGWYPKSLFSVLASSFFALSHHHDNALGRGADILIEPDLSGFSSSKFHDAAEILAAGYTAGKAAVPAIREKLGLDVMPTQSVFSRFISRFTRS